MIQVKNTTNKRITFPVLSFSIGPNETKIICLDILDKVLFCKDIIEVEKKERTSNTHFSSKQHTKNMKH